MGNFLGMLQKEEKKWAENDSAQKKSIEELKEKISKSKLSTKEKEDLSESIKSINTINPYNNFNASY